MKRRMTVEAQGCFLDIFWMEEKDWGGLDQWAGILFKLAEE